MSPGIAFGLLCFPSIFGRYLAMDGEKKEEEEGKKKKKKMWDVVKGA